MLFLLLTNLNYKFGGCYKIAKVERYWDWFLAHRPYLRTDWGAYLWPTVIDRSRKHQKRRLKTKGIWSDFFIFVSKALSCTLYTFPAQDKYLSNQVHYKRKSLLSFPLSSKWQLHYPLIIPSANHCFSENIPCVKFMSHVLDAIPTPRRRYNRTKAKPEFWRQIESSRA